jgi:ABC-type Na+ efflux pump permease subunit
METNSQHLYFSFGRLWTIARNTMTEVIRQKFFYILVIFGIVVLVSSIYFSQFSASQVDHIKFIKDFSFGAIKLFCTAIAIVGTAQLIPLELENRTIYPILAKPVYRVEFLLGKYLGMITLILLTMILMGVFFWGVLGYTEKMALRDVAGTLGAGETQMEAQGAIFKETRDPALLKAGTLIYFQMLIICAVSLLVSTFATSVIFNLIATFLIYICGHLAPVAREVLMGNQGLYNKFLMYVIVFFVPDMSAFDKVDQVVMGEVVQLDYVLKTIGYGLMYAGVVLFAAYSIFEEKEI